MKLSWDAPKRPSQDECPTMPLRRSFCAQRDNSEISDADSITDSLLPPPTSDEKTADLSTIVSDITEPSGFASVDASWNASPNNSFNDIDSSWRNDSLDTSLRIESLGPLEEEKSDNDSFDTPVRKIMLVSSSMDREVFESAQRDMPPQLAVRFHSSMDWTVESQPMDVRFDGSATEAQDKPMTLPKPSYSQQAPMPAPSGLLKLAQIFTSGCAIGTHTYHLMNYPNTFVGSQAVDFMLSANLASTREDAVFLGQRFCKELNLFHHVYWDHTFKDGLFFYRFKGKCTKDVRCATPLSRKDLVKLSEKFVEGMPVSKHKSRRMKTYRNTFLGEQAVNYMLQAKLASNRPDAVFLGQRMMEELDIFEPVSHNSRFKDSYYLYRFVTGKGNSSSFDESATIGSLMESVGAQHHQYTPLRNLPPTRPLLSSALSSTTIGGKQKELRVSFGTVGSRFYERHLDCNPATTSGPSLGLGWRFYDDLPIPLSDENSNELEFRGGRLSIKDRTRILKEWGYNKGEISRATKLNKIIRQKRKRSLNKDMKHL
ncbi:MAG: hypothetical protein SGBAC_005864 [Bacillariaceae sp.]